MNIVLIGLRGSGKSTVGRGLAARMGREFVDTDDLVEKCLGASIKETVNKKGWSFFRAVEKGVVEDVCHGDHLVIAAGGGAVLDPENVRSLKKNGLVIWLKADRQVLYDRINQDPRTMANRPTLTGKGALEELGEIMAYREPFYEKAADMQLDTTELGAEGVVERILSILEEKMGGS
ncbi:MAG: shikimate kinase [Deltaproteobacteria bacterium]|nr:shikimate kinase [Deltaproteobacteria bacterium]